MAKLKVIDAQTGKAAWFDGDDARRWMLPSYSQDGEVLYEHYSQGHWTLLKYRRGKEWIDPPEAIRLNNQEAAEWFQRHDWQAPSELSRWAEDRNFHPGPSNDLKTETADESRVETDERHTNNKPTLTHNRTAVTRARRGVSIESRMEVALVKMPESRGWSITEWTTYLGCSRAGVQGTKLWRTLHATHVVAQVSRKDHQNEQRGLKKKGIDKRKTGRNID